MKKSRWGVLLPKHPIRFFVGRYFRGGIPSHDQKKPLMEVTYQIYIAQTNIGYKYGMIPRLLMANFKNLRR